MAVSRKAMTEGIRTSLFPGTFNIYNPSVSRLRETREPAPFTQGSRWVLPHQCVFQWYSEEPGDCRTSNEATPRESPHFPVVFLKNLCYNNSIFAVWRQL